jgi:hypothetical protein
MSDFSPQQLEDKIHTFMKSKEKKFPELGTEQYHVDQVKPKTREGISRNWFPTVRFGAQY